MCLKAVVSLASFSLLQLWTASNASRAKKPLGFIKNVDADRGIQVYTIHYLEQFYQA